VFFVRVANKGLMLDAASRASTLVDGAPHGCEDPPLQKARERVESRKFRVEREGSELNTETLSVQRGGKCGKGGRRWLECERIM
jgi:hypothetical protein